jgi:hypothetical protein
MKTIFPVHSLSYHWQIMGRKKKCEFSRDNLFKNIENNKESDKLPAKESSKSKGPAHVTEDSAELEDKWSDEVFEDEDEDQDKEADDDMEELSRLMSIVDIEDDPEELEKQINLAGTKSRYTKDVTSQYVSQLINSS